MKDIYSKLADFGKELLNKKSLVEGLPLISKYAKQVIGADRCSVFIYNSAKDELWTTMADGIEKIIIPSDKSIVGHTLEVKKPLLVHDAESDPLLQTENHVLLKKSFTSRWPNDRLNLVSVG